MVLSPFFSSFVPLIIPLIVYCQTVKECSFVVLPVFFALDN